MEQKNFWTEHRTIVAYAVSLLALAEIVDLTIVAVAIPNIMGSLGANLSEVSLTMTSYIVAAAVCIPLTGLVANKFGMKRVTLVSSAIFGISSVLCGLSTSLTQMVLFRLIQGIGGAFLPSVAQSYISQNFTQEEQPKIMMVYSLCVVMGPVIGPIFGGALAENLTWRWVFYVNVPICLAGFTLVLMYMKKDILTKVKIDYLSFAFMAIGVACLEYFIDEGNTNNWFDSMEMIIILAISLVLITLFIWRGLIGKSVIDFRIFKYKNLMLSCAMIFLFFLMVTASMAYFPTMLQQTYGYPVDTAGYVTAPRGIAAFFAAPILMALMQKVDARKIIFWGLLIFAASCFILASYGPTVSMGLVITTVAIQGAGMMSVFVPTMQMVFIDVPEELHNDASGIFNFFRNIASSIGTSLSATIVSHQMQTSWHDLASHVNPYSMGFLWWKQSIPTGPEQMQVAIAQMKIMQQSSLISYLDSFYIFGFLLLGIIWLPFFLKRPPAGASMGGMH